MKSVITKFFEKGRIGFSQNRRDRSSRLRPQPGLEPVGFPLSVSVPAKPAGPPSGSGQRPASGRHPGSSVHEDAAVSRNPTSSARTSVKPLYCSIAADMVRKARLRRPAFSGDRDSSANGRTTTRIPNRTPPDAGSDRSADPPAESRSARNRLASLSGLRGGRDAHSVPALRPVPSSPAASSFPASSGTDTC